jgi:hypothetical protein
MEGASTLPKARRLGIREQSSPWPQAVLGAGNPAEVYLAQGARTRNRKTIWLAYLSAHLLDSLEERWH